MGLESSPDVFGAGLRAPEGSPAGGAGSGSGAVMSQQQTIRPLEQTNDPLEGGPDIPAVHDVCFHCVRSRGAVTSPDRRHHALGESDGSLHIAGSLEKTRCPWFLRPSNQALARAMFPSGMVGRSHEASIPRSTRKAGLTDGSRPHRTTSGSRWLMSRWPSSSSARCRSGSSSVPHNAWVPGHKAF